MKVTLGASTLVPGGAESATEFAIDGQQLVEVEQYIRALAAEPMERGNMLHTFEIACEREHATALAAQEFVAQHHAGLVKTGTLTLECQSNTGAGSANVAYPNAVLDRHKGNFLGSRTFHRYTILAGAPS